MPRFWPRLLQVAIILAIPIAFLALSLRITTAPWLPRWEYRKPGFPADPYGLTTEERVRFAEICVEYLITRAEIDLLANLELEGRPAFNQRELQHMVDVKRVLWNILWAGAIGWIIIFAGSAGLLSRRALRPYGIAALRGGALLTLCLLAAVGGLMLVRWDVFFTGFHELLFPPDTWTFPTSDTLIRLYPEKFWMDVGIVIVGLILTQAVTLGIASWILEKRLIPRGCTAGL